MKPLRLLGDARFEVNEAADFYEDRRPGLGRKWRLAVAKALDEVQRHPRIGRSTASGPKQYHMDGYPYYVIFIERPDDILVISFAHEKREPEFWRNRL